MHLRHFMELLPTNWETKFCHHGRWSLLQSLEVHDGQVTPMIAWHKVTQMGSTSHRRLSDWVCVMNHQSLSHVVRDRKICLRVCSASRPQLRQRSFSGKAGKTFLHVWAEKPMYLQGLGSRTRGFLHLYETTLRSAYAYTSVS